MVPANSLGGKLLSVIGIAMLEAFRGLIQLACATWVCTCCLCASTCAVEVWNPPGILARVKISTNGEPICVPGTVAGKQILFVVDTGATRTILDPLVLKSPATARTTRLGTGKSIVAASLHDSPNITIAGIEWRWITEIAAIDLRVVRLGTGADVLGILGMDVLSRFVMHIDTDNGVLLLCDPRQVQSPPGIELPLSLDRFNCPTVGVQMGAGREVAFLIDTGCLATGQLSDGVLRAVEDKRSISQTGTLVPGYDFVGERLSTDRVRCSSLELGKIPNKDLVLSVASDNVLGLYFLCRYQTTLNFDRRTIAFKRGDRFSLADRQDFLGLTLTCTEANSFVVSRVHPNSLGSKSGFKDGDQLLSIDAKPIGELSVAAVMRLVGFPSKKDLIFTVRRAGVVQQVKVPGG